jgi:hypothetical protein
MIKSGKHKRVGTPFYSSVFSDFSTTGVRLANSSSTKRMQKAKGSLRFFLMIFFFGLSICGIAYITVAYTFK